MQAPMQKNLLIAFRDLSSKDARLIRTLCHLVDSPDALESVIDTDDRLASTAAYCRSLYNHPWDSAGWRRTVVMHALDKILGMHGVEALYTPDQDQSDPRSWPRYEYCNSGDSYGTTLVMDRDLDLVRIGCWGDIAERWET